MSVLSSIIQAELWLFLAGCTLVLLHHLASSDIDIGEAQLNRIQLLLTTVGFAAYYLAVVVSRLADTDTTALPDPGSTVTIAFGGSSLLYLVNKIIGAWPSIFSAAAPQQGG